MLLLRSGVGIRIASFLRFSTATKTIQSNFHCSLWPLLCASNSREAKQTFTNFNSLVEKKQYFCSNTIDVDMEIAKRAEIGTGTALDDERPQEQKNDCDDSIQLAKKFMRSMADGGEHRNFTVELCQGRSGIKFFEFSNLINGRFFNSPKFLVPGEAYQFVRAMDELLRELATKEGVKLPRSSERRVLFSTGLSGVSYDFKLDLQWMDGQFAIKLSTCRTEAKPDHREKLFMLNVKQLHWIRHVMGKMLVEFDGTQPVDEPPKFPDWLSFNGRPRRPVQLQMPVQTYQNNRLQRQQMPVETVPMMEFAQKERPKQSQLMLAHEQFGKRFNTGNMDMDKNAMARGENIEDGNKLAKMQLSSFGVGEVPEQLEIALAQDRIDGTKFVEFRKEIDQEINHFRKIRVPLEVYPFARAMDLLLGKLAMEEGGQKFPSTGSRVPFSTSSPGMVNDFKLDLMLVDGHFVVKLGEANKPGDEHKEMKPFWLSVKEFHWFRQSMGEILAKFDGSQQLDLPPKLPDWLLKDDRPIPYSGQYPNPLSKPGRNEPAEHYPSQYRQNNRQSRVPQPYNNNNSNMASLAQRQLQPRTWPWPRQTETAGNYRQHHQQPSMTWDFGGGGNVSSQRQREHGQSGQDKLDDTVQEDEK